LLIQEAKMSPERRDHRDLIWAALTAASTALATQFVDSLPRWVLILVIALSILYLILRRYLDRSRKAVHAIWAFTPHALGRSGANPVSPRLVEGRRRFRRWTAVVAGGVTAMIILGAIASPLVLDRRQQVRPDDPTVVACYEDLDRNAKASVLKTALVAEPGGAIAECRDAWQAAFGHVAPDHLVNCVLAEGGQAVFPGRGKREPEQVCEVVNGKPFA
jgi:hypothetical protein